MARYLFMVRSDPNSTACAMSAEEREATIGKYMAWVKSLEPGGHLLAGEKLRDKQGRVLRRKEMTSAVIGVRTLDQLKDNLGALKKLKLSADEIAAIDKATKGALLDLHPQPGGWLR